MSKLPAAVYDILNPVEEGAGKRDTECALCLVGALISFTAFAYRSNPCLCQLPDGFAASPRGRKDVTASTAEKLLEESALPRLILLREQEAQGGSTAVSLGVRG